MTNVWSKLLSSSLNEHVNSRDPLENDGQKNVSPYPATNLQSTPWLIRSTILKKIALEASQTLFKSLNFTFLNLLRRNTSYTNNEVDNIQCHGLPDSIRDRPTYRHSCTVSCRDPKTNNHIISKKVKFG